METARVIDVNDSPDQVSNFNKFRFPKKSWRKTAWEAFNNSYSSSSTTVVSNQIHAWVSIVYPEKVGSNVLKDSLVLLVWLSTEKTNDQLLLS